MRYFVFALMLLGSVFAFMEVSEAIPACTTRSGSCNAGETCMVSIFQENDSHVGACGYFDYSVCCTEVASAAIRSTGCNANEGNIMSVSQENDTHAGSYTYYSSVLCGRTTTNKTMGNVRSSCNSRENCMLSVFQENDTHVGACGYFSSSICIQEFFNVTITVNLNDTVPTWSGGLVLTGRATRSDGTNVDTDAVGVVIYRNSTTVCTNETNSSGHYSCYFTAPDALGRYELNVTVFDPTTNRLSTNSTSSFNVRPQAGATKPEETSAEDIACYEEPRIIQNPDGTIKISNVRICVWK